MRKKANATNEETFFTRFFINKSKRKHKRKYGQDPRKVAAKAHYILVCQEEDHKYLVNWLDSAD